jgi:hypothetical protein
MKYNLIFENIPEVIPNTDIKEDTQQILRFSTERIGD